MVRINTRKIKKKVIKLDREKTTAVKGKVILGSRKIRKKALGLQRRPTL